MCVRQSAVPRPRGRKSGYSLLPVSQVTRSLTPSLSLPRELLTFANCPSECGAAPIRPLSLGGFRGHTEPQQGAVPCPAPAAAAPPSLSCRWCTRKRRRARGGLWAGPPARHPGLPRASVSLSLFVDGLPVPSSSEVLPPVPAAGAPSPGGVAFVDGLSALESDLTPKGLASIGVELPGGAEGWERQWEGLAGCSVSWLRPGSPVTWHQTRFTWSPERSPGLGGRSGAAGHPARCSRRHLALLVWSCSFLSMIFRSS